MAHSEIISVVLPIDLLGAVRARAAAREPGSTQASIATAVVSHIACVTEPLEDDALVAELDAVMRGEVELIPAQQAFDQVRAEMAHRAEPSTRAVQAHGPRSDVVVSPPLGRGAATMSQKERIAIELPADVAARLREAVAAGTFASQSEAVEQALEMLLLADAGGRVADDAWLRREVVPVLDRIDRGEEETVPLEDAFRGLEERYRARKASGSGR